MTVQCAFYDPELLAATVAEYRAEIQDEIDRCYECGEALCLRHCRMLDEKLRNLDSLAAGMLVLRESK